MLSLISLYNFFLSFKSEKVCNTVSFECHTSNIFYFALGIEKGEREKKFHIFCPLSL